MLRRWILTHKYMSIEHDTTTKGLLNVAGTTLTFSHTCTGSNLVLVVGVGTSVAGGAIPSGVTYNGVALTFIDNSANGNPNTNTSLWYLVAPATGTHDVVVTTAVNAAMSAGATSLTGVDQTSPLGITGKENATNRYPSLVIATGTDNSWIVDVLSADGYVPTTTGTNQTARWDEAVPSVGFTPAGSTETTTTTGNYTMSWDMTISDQYSHVAAEFKPASIPFSPFPSHYNT